MDYDEIQHVEFNGARIYMPEIKIDMIKSKEYWTVSQLQRRMRCGYNSAVHLIEYMKSIGVLGGPALSHGCNRYYVINTNK